MIVCDSSEGSVCGDEDAGDTGDAGPDEGPACSTSDAVEAPTEAPAGAAAPLGTESAAAGPAAAASRTRNTAAAAGPGAGTSDAGGVVVGIAAPAEAPADAAAPPGTESAASAAGHAEPVDPPGHVDPTGHVAMATVRVHTLSRLCLGALRVLSLSNQSRIYHSSQNRTATRDPVKARLVRPPPGAEVRSPLMVPRMLVSTMLPPEPELMCL